MPRRVSFIERLNEYLGAASQDARLIVKDIVDAAVQRHKQPVQRAQARRSTPAPKTVAPLTMGEDAG